ncbi:MAG: DUF1792 domain-containing protein [Cyclobacteriaceae bacterium]|nr:DUF1792 domain-containing protein [Cyclobacteriaceae bacterium]
MKKKIIRWLRIFLNYEWWVANIHKFKNANNLDNCTLLNDADTIDYLLNTKKSFIRWGDGETNILMGGDLSFQEYDKELARDLRKLLIDSQNGTKLLLGIPHRYLSVTKSEFHKQDKRFVGLWYKSRYIFDKYVLENNIYGDAFVFRKESPLTRETVSQLWSKKKIILVSSKSEHIKKIYNANQGNGIIQILCPSKNSYSYLDDMYQKVKEAINNSVANGNKISDIMVLISSGPGGKVLAHQLINDGYKVVDTGHYFTWKA